jgi:hypothetical protein
LAINSLFPAFFRLFSTSEFAPHVSTHPTREWDNSGGDAGSFLAWDNSDVDAIDMITDFVDALLPFYTAETSFNQAIIYNMADENAPPLPRGFVSFTGKVGSSVVAAIPASQSMYTFRSSNFGLLKVVMLDAPVTTDFQPFTDIASSAALEDLFDIMKLDTNAFAARDNGQPAQFIRATFKLNDELRHQYRLD